MSRFKDLPIVHPLAGVGTGTFAKLICEHGVDPGYRLRAAMLMATCMLGVPLRGIDTLMSSRLIERTPPPPRPTFIIGHWRSGTTHLHNLLSLDPAFGCLRGIHCLAARSFLGARKPLQKVLRPFLPAKRPMDEVGFGLDMPQEDDFALSRVAPISHYHTFSFPRRMKEIFDRWITFETASPQDIAHWQRTYDWILRRVGLDEGGRPLCLKSPPHTARIPVLLEMFPDARFVYIHRSPYFVQASNLRMWRQMIGQSSLHRPDEVALEHCLEEFYRKLLGSYLSHRTLIPEGRLVEVRFEELERDGVGQIKKIYETLGMDGFDTVRPRITSYLGRHRDYRKNTYQFDPTRLDRVEDQWGFSLKEWPYERPSTSAALKA